MIQQLIQQQIPLGGRVKFILSSGREISGILSEISLNHVLVKTKSGISTLPLEKIDFWEIPDEEEQQLEREVSNALSSNQSKNEEAAEISEDKEAEDRQSAKSEKSLLESQKNSPRIYSDQDTRKTESKAQKTSNSFNLDSYKKLIEIEARFDAKIASSQVNLIPPDFRFPEKEMKGNRQRDANKVWIRAKNKYDNAVKNNELGNKFGRLTSIILDFELLNEWFTESSSAKRHLAFLRYISGDKQSALKHYKAAAINLGESVDWHNVAVISNEFKENTLACYALNQFFLKSDISGQKHKEIWYKYVDILINSGDFYLLKLIIKNDKKKLSKAEYHILMDTILYLLVKTNKKDLAQEIFYLQKKDSSLEAILSNSIKYFSKDLSKEYQNTSQSIIDDSKRTQSGEGGSNYKISSQPRGYVYTYTSHRNFGFIRGIDGTEYFFHRSAVIDEELSSRINNLKKKENIPVIFESTEGAKGLLAIGISLHRNIDQLFELASQQANNGDYAKAIAQIRKVLTTDPDYPKAQELYERWREYARFAGVPRGSNPYARAKRVQLIERDTQRASDLLKAAIEQGDNVESAIKDLAQLLVQMDQVDEAISLLNKNRSEITNSTTVDNLLINIYQKASKYDEAINLLKKKLVKTNSKEIKSQILRTIASCYLKQENYQKAEEIFQNVSDLGIDDAQLSIAFCLIKQNNYFEAEAILNSILETSQDTQATELLAIIERAKLENSSARIDEITVDTILSTFSSEVSPFTQFYLERCQFEGVPPVDRQRYEEGLREFNHLDVKKIEDFATKARSYRPAERAERYLSAAKVVSLIEEWDDPNRFYKYLCRSHASKGDDAVISGSPIDTAREWYCEALKVYDGNQSQDHDEQDAVNAIKRFLFLTLGQAQIPVDSRNMPPIDEVIEQVLNLHPQRDRAFELMLYLTTHSRFATNRLLTRMYNKSSLQAMALDYIKNKMGKSSSTTPGKAEFLQLWKELQRRGLDEIRSISTELRALTKIKLTTAWLESRIPIIRGVEEKLLLDLDQQRIRQIQKILEALSDLCKQNTFEGKESYCDRVDTYCQDLLKEIEANPTRISVIEIFPIAKSVQEKTSDKRQEIYESSVPQITLRLPEGLESYLRDINSAIEIQIVVENKIGCSPAESLELIVQEEDSFFVVNYSDIKLDGSLRGGAQEILTISLRLTEQAIKSETFSLPIYAKYRTRSEDIAQTQTANFSIRLYSEEQFEEIENPYAIYADSAIVEDKSMFYGRNELISNTARTLLESQNQNKCIVIFGQKRSGKSSILYHLKLDLEKDKDLLILDIGNIGSILDEYSSIPLLYQILWAIVRRLEYAIEDKVEENYDDIPIIFPKDEEFYRHSSPLSLFKETFEKFKRVSSKKRTWKNVRIVLLIDEFSYIYSQITSGKISEEFMKNWKALLQENFFSAVLVGQDVMPKFKQRFPNEFGIAQDERVSYLKPEDAAKLIDEPIRIGGKGGKSRYVEKAIERIIELTAGSPFYIQIFCTRLVDYMNRKKAKLVTKSDVEQIKLELIQGVNALSIDKFDNLINSGDTSADAISDEDAIKVLTAIAENSRTGACNRHSIVCDTKISINDILKDLENREVVKREQENYYRIRVELFKEWLITNPQ